MAATVLQLSDTHLGRAPGQLVYDLDPDARVRAVLDAWVRTGQQADLVLLTGDLSDAGDDGACQRLADLVATVDAPVLALPGNHDLPAVVRATWGDDDVASVGAWRIVSGDTTIPGQVHGAVDVSALMTRLDALDERPTIVALHHPPLSRSTDRQFQLDGAAELLAALAERPHIRAVVAGHLHDAVELQGPTGPPVLLCPSTLMGITHDGDRMTIDPAAPRGARVLHLADDGTVTSDVLEA